MSFKSFVDNKGKSIGIIIDSLNPLFSINSFVQAIALFTPFALSSLIMTMSLNLSSQFDPFASNYYYLSIF